jgi:hypothetical protein
MSNVQRLLITSRVLSFGIRRRPTFVKDRFAASLLILAVPSLSLAACGSPASQNQKAKDPVMVTSREPSGAIAATSAPASVYVPHFDDQEGDTYFYASAVSEEDKKKGKAVGGVVNFRYLGESGGVHKIASVDDRGRALLRYECPTPCRIIKRTFDSEIERIPYDPQSVIGAAFEDALNGSLRVTRLSGADAKLRPSDNTIPAAFIGEWNTDTGACGTDNNDSRLRISASHIRFYESDAEVQRVTVLNQRAIKVDASFAGEGQSWNDQVEFVLSRSGNDLSSGEIIRHRCTTT